MRKSDLELDRHAGTVARALRLVRADLEHNHPSLAPVFLVASVLRGRCGAISVDVGFENDWSADVIDHMKSAARALLSEFEFETRDLNWVPALPYVIIYGAPPTNHERLTAIRRRRSRRENGP
ncbi:hypothetical protein [Phaeobacter sp. 22II1-1F12B]|uniref:hypothetical protein n=1 Tax=Phaeobacter sp. 22II1-1F12B TaxID=1317111 RepID=UPI000B5259EF|nr:hypothetical protein [Phaeobacter sp. 22II1-1F12B]OWU68609.1 hypothetical protein ATO1_25170 [Phaeobacter sp. 22II1-1F12B]